MSTHKALNWDKDSFRNVIDGQLTSTKETRHSLNPANGEPNPEVPVTTQEDVEKAMTAGTKAFKTWSQVPYADRQKAVLKFADAVEAEKPNFAKMLVQEQGKPYHFADFEVNAAIHWLRTLAAIDLPEEKYEDGEKETIVRYTPLGLVVGIVPWNYPILLAAGKIGPSLVAGCPIIIKPSPFTPAGDLKLVELAQQFFPPGVVQALSGDDNLGPWLTEHPAPQKISFTGSSFTGKKVMASAAKTLKRVTLELGGKDPAIICEDAPVDETAKQVATFSFMNTGQICIALKRILVHEKIFDEFRDAMVKHTKDLKMGEGNEDGVFLGPINNSMQYEKVKGFYEDIEKQGQKVAVGGSNPDGKGYYVTPTIIDRPDRNSRIVKEEPFGPIVPLLSFSSYDEAIEIANDTPYGLGASVWGADVNRANGIARKIEAGNVWINTHFDLDPRVPFGGHKESGIGTEWGLGGLKSYCNSQTLYLKKPANAPNGTSH